MIIKEFLPNPIGSDKEGEYIKIFNDSDKAVDLSGWKISDASGKNFNLSGAIKPKEELILFSSKTKISLNNSGETVFLFNEKEDLVDKLGYSGKADEGKIIASPKLNVIKQEFRSGEVLNQAMLPSPGRIIATDFLAALILGLLAVYVILQLEKKLNIKLF